MIWIEILSRQHEIAARFRIAGPEARIGRGYDNDVIVDDPYVAAAHLRLFRDEAGQLVLEDLGSANGTYLDGARQRLSRIIVDGRQPIRIGQTYLRIREANFAVEPERFGRPQRNVLTTVLVAALSVALLAIQELSIWLNQTSEQQATAYLWPLLGLIIIVLAWAGVWALLSRIFSGRLHFLRNLLITLTGALVASFYSEIAQLVAYALTWSTPRNYDYVAVWLVLAVMCFFHLTKIGPPRLLLKGSILAILFVGAVGTQTLQQSEAFFRSGRQTTTRLLLPPALRMVPLRNEDAFFGEIAKLKATLDRDRFKARPDDVIR